MAIIAAGNGNAKLQSKPFAFILPSWRKKDAV